MTSWKLWSALQNPPALNPVFRRTANVEYLFSLRFPAFNRLRRLVLVGLFVFILLLLITYPRYVLLFILIVPMSIMFVLLVVPILLVIGSNLMGVIWSSSVSTTIVREREHSTYDLLCLLPDGVFGATWAIGSGCIHRGAFFELLQLGVRTFALFGIIILGIMVIVTLGIAASPPFYDGEADLIRAITTVLDMIAIIIGYYAHHIQSVVLSPLTGILTSIYVRNQLEARLFAPIIFLALQVGSYALTFLIAFRIIPDIYHYFALTDSLTHMTLPFAQLAIFYAIREGILFAVWTLVKQELNIHPSEFNRLVSLP